MTYAVIKDKEGTERFETASERWNRLMFRDEIRAERNWRDAHSQVPVVLAYRECIIARKRREASAHNEVNRIVARLIG